MTRPWPDLARSYDAVAAEFDARFRREFETLLRLRRDVRRFRSDPIDPDLLQGTVDLARFAPSVGLSEPWRFVSVENEAARDGVIASFERCNAEALGDYPGATRAHYARLKLAGLREAPVHLAVFADEATVKGKGLGRRTMPEMLSYSAVMAVYAFWLAARAAGLGVGWVSILDPVEVAAAVRAPAAWRLVAYLCVGWPDEEHDDPELERAGWETRSLHVPINVVRCTPFSRINGPAAR